MVPNISKVVTLFIVMQICGRGDDSIIFEFLRLPEETFVVEKARRRTNDVAASRFHNGRCPAAEQRHGSNCSWNQVDGVCTRADNCRTALVDLHNKNPPLCSIQDDKKIICCTDCEIADATSSLTNRFGPVELETGRKAKEHCMNYLKLQGEKCKNATAPSYAKYKNSVRNCHEVFLVGSGAGGENAKRDQFRHMAQLGYGDDMESAKWLCGGSLISNKFILTAGHCISSPNLGPVRYAALGILKRSDPLELWQRYHVKRIVRHPQYKPPSKYHDIALLETATEVIFNDHVGPACLQFFTYPEVRADRSAAATGWGALGNNGSQAETLQAVYLDQFEEPECSRLYPQHRHLSHGYNHTTQMCYGNRKEVRDTCEGDSGGPLQNQNYISPCMYTILGVTSSGRPCGVVGGSGLYTRVIHYVPWIESVVWPD